MASNPEPEIGKTPYPRPSAQLVEKAAILDYIATIAVELAELAERAGCDTVSKDLLHVGAKAQTLSENG